MTKEVTLNSIIEKIRPAQQDYLVALVRNYGDREDMHRGLLPFLSAELALNYLAIQGIYTEMREEGDERDKNMHFIRTLQSRINEIVPQKLYADEDSVVMQLSTLKLRHEFGRRFGKKFHVTLGPGVHSPHGLAELEMMGKDKWRVTTHKKRLNEATTWLADTFR